VKNVMGAELTEAETRLAECYNALARLVAEHREDLAPYQERNALKALAALWQVANGLDLEPGQVYHLGA
jgi:hypothetical protein